MWALANFSSKYAVLETPSEGGFIIDREPHGLTTVYELREDICKFNVLYSIRYKVWVAGPFEGSNGDIAGGK